MSYHYALAGNPNSGKTTLFNAITGSNQYVGNWSRVTVEKKEGKIIEGGVDATVVDLPGIYSLSPYSMEEIVARNYILDEKPDLIINIADATNLERNLYLSLQLAELGRPIVIALNMMDALRKSGGSVDCKLLSKYLSIPVYPISSNRNEGIKELLRGAAEHVKDVSGQNGCEPPHIYDEKVEMVIEYIESLISDICRENEYPLRWTAIKLIEGDQVTLDKLRLPKNKFDEIEFYAKSLESENVDRKMVIADQKYKFICSVCEKCLKKRSDGKKSISDKIDMVFTNRILAIPLFFGLMFLIFMITFSGVGMTLTELIDDLINVRLAEAVRELLTGFGTAEWAVGLICDGAIAGVGAVLQFFPQIFILFFFLSVLEDSGYMARASFIMDRAMCKLGLSGKSFVPMIMGFGCTVPAVMACRTLENDRERRLTIMMTPFMSCSAKMPVYSLFISAFFVGKKAVVMLGIYMLGILVAVLAALIVQKLILKSKPSEFIMELPPYRLPTVKTLGRHLKVRIADFLNKAGKILLLASIVIWIMQYFDFSFHHVEDSSQSMLGVIGTFIAPIFKPLGFGEWQSSVSILSGLITREGIVSTLGILYGATGDTAASLVPVLQSVFTPASAISFMTFSLLFIPCVAAVSAIRSEMRSKKWTACALAFQMVTAYVVTFVVYRVALLIF